jgi:hypothetical protein
VNTLVKTCCDCGKILMSCLISEPAINSRAIALGWEVEGLNDKCPKCIKADAQDAQDALNRVRPLDGMAAENARAVPIYDQGETGASVACAMASAMAHINAGLAELAEHAAEGQVP